MHEHDRTDYWDEPTFRYLLAVEAARARRARRPFLVLVADARRARGSSGDQNRLAGTELPELAPALARCLRETDVVGWHRKGRTAGAVLTEVDPGSEAARLIGTKVLRALRAALSTGVASRLRVQIYRYGASGARGGFERVFAATGTGETITPAEDVRAAVAGRTQPLADACSAGSAPVASQHTRI